MAISKPFAYNPSTSFSIGSGFNNNVISTSIQSDGKILVGGEFTTFTGNTQNRLIRLNSDGSKDTSFDIGSGFGGGFGTAIRSISIQSDGKILVGGIFQTFTGSTENTLIRLNSDGSKDTSFQNGFDTGAVESFVIQSDGKILVGGTFTTFSGSSQNNLIRLNSDGSKDTSFNIGSGFGPGVNSIAIQSNGKVLVGGGFTTFTGSTQNRLIRLNSDGSKDSTFDIGSGFNGNVNAVAIQPDGKILVGGDFVIFTGSSQNYLIRLNSDGSKDETFDIGTGFNNYVESIAIQSDGKILVGGYYTTYKDLTQNYFIRLNSDGSKDTSFNIGTGFNEEISAIRIDSNGKILVGGWFTQFTGTSQNYLIKLNSDGSIFSGGTAPTITGTTQYGDIVVGNIQRDYSGNYGGVKWWGGPNEELGYVIGNARPGGQPVPIGVTGGPAYVGFWRSPLLTDNSFLSLANYIGAQNSEPPFATTSDAVTWLNDNGYYTSYSGGTQLTGYYIGGNFSLVNSISANGLISLNSGGTQNTTFSVSEISGGFRSTLIDSNGKILIGGSGGSGGSNGVLRLNLDGSVDTSFNIGDGFDELVYSLSVGSDEKIVVGGDFSTFTGSTQNKLIRLNSDGSKDETFDIGSGFNGLVWVTKIDNNEKVLAGGWFTTYQDLTQNSLIRLNSDGTKDSTFDIGTGFDNYVNSIAIQSDGKILVGGDFTTFTGSSQNYLIRLNSDGSKDTSFNIGTGFDVGVYSIAVQSNGKILVGGSFTTFTGSSQNGLIRLNSDGSKDETFDIANGFDASVVESIEIQSDGKILVGGSFTTFTGSTQNKLIRLNSDGSKDTTFDVGVGFTGGDVISISINSEGSIFVGGGFSGYQGIPSIKLMKINNDFVTVNENFNIGTGFDSTVRTTSIQSDGNILVGGSFTTFTGSTQNYLIRLNSDGTKDSTFDIGSGFDSLVWVTKIDNNGKILVGGFFSTYQDLTQNYLIRLNSDGSKDETFDIGTGFGHSFFPPAIFSINIQSDGKILVGGRYDSFSGSSQDGLIRLNSDGSKDTSFNIGSGFGGGNLFSIEIQSDGKILVGGEFITFTGSSQNNLIRLNSDGSKDTSFDIGTGFNNVVYSTEIQSDGKILVGGIFSTYQDLTQNSLIRLNSDGTKDETFDIGTGFDNSVNSVKIKSDGKILVGGDFTIYNGSSAPYSVNLNNDGSMNGAQIKLNDTVSEINF